MAAKNTLNSFPAHRVFAPTAVSGLRDLADQLVEEHGRAAHLLMVDVNYISEEETTTGEPCWELTAVVDDDPTWDEED